MRDCRKTHQDWSPRAGHRLADRIAARLAGTRDARRQPGGGTAHPGADWPARRRARHPCCRARCHRPLVAGLLGWRCWRWRIGRPPMRRRTSVPPAPSPLLTLVLGAFAASSSIELALAAAVIAAVLLDLKPTLQLAAADPAKRAQRRTAAAGAERGDTAQSAESGLRPLRRAQPLRALVGGDPDRRPVAVRPFRDAPDRLAAGHPVDRPARGMASSTATTLALAPRADKPDSAARPPRAAWPPAA